MSIFTRIKNIFRRKKPKEELPPLEELPKESGEKPVEKSPEAQRMEFSDVKAKLDLVLTQLDNIKTQNQMMNERLKAMEKTLTEMRGIRYY